MILWLDDVREPWKHGHVGAEWCRTAEEAIALLETGKVTRASLDHDLLPEHYPWNCKTIPPRGAGTGFDVVCWMEENNVWPPEGVTVHSLNEEGKERMQKVIDRHQHYPIGS